nr:hypothetical protein [Tanacetum cinerariifolium]
MFKIHVMHYEVTWFKEATEFNRIFNELDNAYAKCFADNQSLYAMNKRNIAKNKCLEIQKKSLLIHDESLIADCIAKDVCSIVLASEREVLPRSNCRCEELQSTCDKEHSRVLELEAEIAKKQQMLVKSKNQNSLIQKQFVDLQVKFPNYKECLHNQKIYEQPNATASNAIFEINKLKAQLQEKDDTIRHLHAEKDILGLLNVGSIESRFETKALETKIAQLKEGLTSLKIQNDGYKVTNANLNKCYQELSKANTHLCTTSLEKIATQKAKIATLKAKAVGKKNNWVQPTLLPKKKQVAFLEPHRTSPRSTQKPPVQHKKPTVPVNMFPKVKPTIEARKPIPKKNTQNHNPLPAKSVKARRAADYYRNLYVDINSVIARLVPMGYLASFTNEILVHAYPALQRKESVSLLIDLSSQREDSVIARLVPMGYLASFTNEILVQKRIHNTAFKISEAWYKDKAMLAEAQEVRKILNEEQLTFLTDLRVLYGQPAQTIIPNNAAFQTEDLDSYDSDCDDISNAKAILMANISNYGFDVISELENIRTHQSNGSLDFEVLIDGYEHVVMNCGSAGISWNQVSPLPFYVPCNKTVSNKVAPTEGYEDAIVVPKITADNFELKHGLLTLVQNKQFFEHDKE